MLRFTQGDRLSLPLIAENKDGPIDLTGATFQTTFKGVGSFIVIPNSQHTADPDQVNKKGYFTVALTKQNTQSIAADVNKDIITTLSFDDQTVHVHGFGILTVYENKPQR